MNPITKNIAVKSIAFALILSASVAGISYAAQANEEKKFGMRENITKTVESTDTGIIMTITSDDAEKITKIQEKSAARGEKNSNEDISHSVENIENGVKITVSGSTDDAISKIQDHAEHKGNGGKGGKGSKGGKRGEQGMMKDVTRSVEKTDTGVIITLTSDNADQVTKLQEPKTPKEEKNENVSHSVENIENGVKITVSGSTDDAISKIQDHAEHTGQKRSGKRGGQRNQEAQGE